MLAALVAYAGSEKPSGFDGFDGFLASYYERNDGASGSAMPDVAWETGPTGFVNLQFHVRSVEFRAGLGGVFTFKRYWDGPDAFGGSRYQLFWIGVHEANVRLRFGPPGNSEGVQAGAFRLQTNPDASLFGNYLARYGAYESRAENPVPFWDSLGSRVPVVDGIRFVNGLPGSALRSDLMAIYEFGGFSFLGFLSGKARPGVEWGLGYDFHRALSLGSGGGDFRGYTNGFVKTDTGYIPLAWAARDTVPRPREDTGYYKRTAFMVSARASVDFGILTGGNGRGWRDMALFTEGALLGWSNQPIVFEDRLRRVAWTLGARLPSFGLLDIFTVQWEWRPPAYQPSERAEAAGWVGDVLAPGDSLSPWSAGLLASRNLGKRFALQGRFLVELVAANNYGYFRPSFDSHDPTFRQYRFQIRAMYRLP